MIKTKNTHAWRKPFENFEEMQQSDGLHNYCGEVKHAPYVRLATFANDDTNMHHGLLWCQFQQTFLSKVQTVFYSFCRYIRETKHDLLLGLSQFNCSSGIFEKWGLALNQASFFFLLINTDLWKFKHTFIYISIIGLKLINLSTGFSSEFELYLIYVVNLVLNWGLSSSLV